MSIDKLFHKMQSQVKELRTFLSIFDDETIHPSVQDCDNLREKLNAVQDNLAIYKYQKTNKEISPSFNIHAKVSEKELPIEEIAETIKVANAVDAEKTKDLGAESRVKTKTEEAEQEIKALAIGVNDKFRFINELFAHNNSEYHIVLEQLNNLNSWHETNVYLNSLRDVYGWQERNEVVKFFYAQVKKRFD